MILAFFAASDGIVLENLGMRFMSEIQLAEARAFYGLQIAMENIHSITYSLLLILTLKIKLKNTNYLMLLVNILILKKPIGPLNGSKINVLVFNKISCFFAVVEGIFFSGAFCSIFWLKKRGIMPGLYVSLMN